MNETGIKGTAELTVSAGDTARARRSGTHDVLATPALAELIERCCWESITKHLDEGQTTVGTRLELHHKAPTPMGMAVRCESVLTSVDRRALSFQVRAYDATGEIATAEHDRFIVDAQTPLPPPTTRSTADWRCFFHTRSQARRMRLG